jgi:hypothetical protein
MLTDAPDTFLKRNKAQDDLGVTDRRTDTRTEFLGFVDHPGQ